MSDEKKQRPSGADNNRRVIRIPGALIFWVLLLIVFGVMFFWKSSGANPVVQWDQSKFEQRIADVVKAKVIPEGEDMLYIEGEYKLNEAELAAAKAKNAKADSTGKFRTRVLKKLLEGSEEIFDSLRAGYVSYVINTRAIMSGIHYEDGVLIRRCAVENGVTLFSNLDTVRIVLDVLEEITNKVSTIDAK